MLEDEYYFICKPKSSPQLPYLNPDKNTENRRFRFEAQPIGQRPLVFYNENRAMNRADGITSISPDVLFEGFNLVVRSNIRERLLEYNVPNLSIHASIYIDNDDRWQEDYWYLTFTEEFDCWDRDASDYDQEGPPIRLGGFEYHQVYKYVLNADLMRQTPLEQRLLFKIGGTLDAYIVAHQSILRKVFGSDTKNGAEYIKVSDY